MQYKKIIVRLIFISCIITWSMDLINVKPWEALRSMMVIYFCIPLVSLALSKSAKSYATIGWIIATVLVLALSRFHVYPLIGGAILIAWSIYSLFRHHILLQQRKQITTWALSSIHSWIFGLTCAIAWSFSIMWANNIDVTCDQVHWFINQHLANVLAPLHIDEIKMWNVQTRVDAFFTKSTDQVIQEQVTNQISDQLWWDTWWNMSSMISKQLGWKSVDEITAMIKSSMWWWELSWKSVEQIQQLLKQNPNILNIKSPDTSTLASNNPIAKKLQDRLKNKQFISATVEDKQELDNKICNVVFDQIKLRSVLPWFTFSILLTLILFFYPLIRLATIVYAAVLTVVYTILKKTWFISVVPEEKIVETWVVWDWYQGSTILSAIANMPRKPTPTPQAPVKDNRSPVQKGADALPPTMSASSQWWNINDMLGNMWWWEWWNDEDHIITANSPQDTDTTDIPPPQKKDNWPHVDFGSFWWTFWKKPVRNK